MISIMLMAVMMTWMTTIMMQCVMLSTKDWIRDAFKNVLAEFVP